MDYGVTPDDLLNLSGFGIVIYTGIGGYCDSFPGAIPGHHYIQCCAGFRLVNTEYGMENFTWVKALGEERYKQYITWRDQGRLIYTGFEKWDGSWRYEFSMDIELFEDEGKIDPGTMVFFSSSNSWRLRDIFMDNGAGCFIGWDGPANIYDGLAPLEDMLYTMIKSDTPQPISYAYGQLASVLKKSEYGATLKIDDNNLDFYLPSFGIMKIDFDDPPSGSDHYWITIYPYGTTKADTIYDFDKEHAFDFDDEIEYDGVSPIDTYITITAKDYYRVPLDSSIVFPNLISGENSDVTYTEWNTYGIILETDPSTVESDGISTSTITATLKTFNDDDVTEPTGEVLPCKLVEFITNFGSFIDSYKVMTDENGTAKVELMSDKDGIATVRAIVEKDGMESYKTQNITFGEVPYSFRLAERRQNKANPSGEIIEMMSWGYYLVFKGKENVDYYKITKNHSHPRYSDGYLIKEYSTTGELPYENDYYEELRILSDEERVEWKKEYENGTRFYLFRGDPVSIGSHSDSWKTLLSEKQNDLYTDFTKECIFTIEAYNS